MSTTARQPPAPHPAPGPALSDRAARLATALEEWPRRTIRLEELWTVWDGADPTSTGRAGRRADLAAVVGELADAGLVTVSGTRDRTVTPELPTRLTLPTPEPSASAATLALGTAWRPELAWAATARLTVGQVQHLRRVNSWLRDHAHERDQLPLRERSLQILGHEKTLDRLLATGLFAPDRVTLELLRTFRTHPPLPHVRVGSGRVLLVVENDNTFHSLRAVLTENPGPVGVIAWGAGGAFEASVRSVSDLPEVTCVCYFGDLDADGLRIPRNAAATAVTEGLPAVLPAVGLYRRLLATGAAQAGQPAIGGDTAADLTAWLAADDVAPHVAGLLTSGHRIPQEALTLTALQRDQTWRNDL